MMMNFELLLFFVFSFRQEFSKQLLVILVYCVWGKLKNNIILLYNTYMRVSSVKSLRPLCTSVAELNAALGLLFCYTIYFIFQYENILQSITNYSSVKGYNEKTIQLPSITSSLQ